MISDGIMPSMFHKILRPPSAKLFESDSPIQLQLHISQLFPSTPQFICHTYRLINGRHAAGILARFENPCRAAVISFSLPRVSFAARECARPLVVLHLPGSILPPLYSRTTRMGDKCEWKRIEDCFRHKSRRARRAFALCEWHFPFSARYSAHSWSTCLPDIFCYRRARRVSITLSGYRSCTGPILK